MLILKYIIYITPTYITFPPSYPFHISLFSHLAFKHFGARVDS